MNAELAARLEAKSIPEPNSGCLLWTAHVDYRGYGRLMVDGKGRFAHRLSYECAKGPIPPGLFVCHHCDVPSCINPNHLFVGTQFDNMADMVAKGRWGGAPRHGERNPSAKLTASAVRIIRASTLPGKILGAQFGVTRHAVDAVRNGKAWASVEDTP